MRMNVSSNGNGNGNGYVNGPCNLAYADLEWGEGSCPSALALLTSCTQSLIIHCGRGKRPNFFCYIFHKTRTILMKFGTQMPK